LLGGGFYGVGHRSHVDFGREETVIATRPEMARVAQILAQKFPPGARLKTEAHPASGVYMQVSLIHHLLQRKDTLAKLAD